MSAGGWGVPLWCRTSARQGSDHDRAGAAKGVGVDRDVRARGVVVVAGCLARSHGIGRVGIADEGCLQGRRSARGAAASARAGCRCLRHLAAPAGADLASLFRLGPGGALTKLAELGAFEAANNPAKAQPGPEVDRADRRRVCFAPKEHCNRAPATRAEDEAVAGTPTVW